ncbi:MAG: DUF2397 family protein, partial [Pseudonocardiaceae bacterium]
MFRCAPGHGSSTADWDNLATWFRSRPSTPSRISTLGRDAVNAARRLFDDASRQRPTDLPRLAAAAFGLFPCRHFGAVSGDEEDPVPTATSWWEAPL